MYKFLLCWRYLRTRYIALASIISVTLGVATMIVVNSVMAGFTAEMRQRIHGILSDVVFESTDFNGFRDADWHMEQIRQVAGDDIEGMSPIVTAPALLNLRRNNTLTTCQVLLIGIDEATQAQVSDFGKYLQHPAKRKQMNFRLEDGGYDTRDHQSGPEAKDRPQMARAGWAHRRDRAGARAFEENLAKAKKASAHSADPFAKAKKPDAQERPFDPAKEQRTGVVLGIALASFRDHQGQDHFDILPGDDVIVTLPTAAMPPKFVSDNFTVVDLYESKMSEYDQTFVFVPLRHLQELRGMIDPTSGIGMVKSIQIKLKPGANGDAVRDKLQAKFPWQLYHVLTWQDKQGPLLAAVQMEIAILNVLLFMIIAVAGFGILAIFFMIVVEKTRDVGILKALGASRRGILAIFLAYGLSLGLVGSGVGMILGLLFVRYINEIAGLLGWVTGHPVFDPSIYYFYKIPTLVDPATIGWIVFGALAIAVLAAVLPARRAANLHPVEALRYE